MLDLHDPTTLLVLEIVGGAVLTFGVGAAVNWLRKDIARKRADSDPSNDAAADVEEAIADTLEKKNPASLLKRIFRRK